MSKIKNLVETARSAVLEAAIDQNSYERLIDSISYNVTDIESKVKNMGGIESAIAKGGMRTILTQIGEIETSAKVLARRIQQAGKKESVDLAEQKVTIPVKEAVMAILRGEVEDTEGLERKFGDAMVYKLLSLGFLYREDFKLTPEGKDVAQAYEKEVLSKKQRRSQSSKARYGMMKGLGLTKTKYGGWE